MLAPRLDDARAHDGGDWQYGSYEYEQVRLDIIADGLFCWTDRMELVCGNFRVAPSDDLQSVRQELKRQRIFTGHILKKSHIGLCGRIFLTASFLFLMGAVFMRVTSGLRLRIL